MSKKEKGLGTSTMTGNLIGPKDRRGFLKTLGAGALGLAGTSLLAKTADAQTGVNDAAILNFALNLEYLEAEYYTFGTTGAGIEALGIGVTGEGPLGPVIIKENPQVPFATEDVRQMALETAADERAHAQFLRTALAAAGAAPVARPASDLRDSFAAAGALIGVPGFDPFASELAFLIGAFIFEDVGVTAYKGAAPLLTNKDILENAAGILAVEAYHASWIRTLLFQQRATIVPGSGGQTVAQVVQGISDLRDSVDALDGSGTPGDDRDQGVTPDPVTGTTANIAPTDANAVAFSRTPASVLRIVYLGGAPGEGGGFFPNGVNGPIR